MEDRGQHLPSRAKRNNFDRRYAAMADRLEGFLFRLVVILLVILAVGQTLLSEDSTRVFLSYADRLEGLPLETVEPWGDETPAAPAPKPAPSGGNLSVALINRPAAPQAFLLVNGRRVGDFRGGKVEVAVQPGDFVAVDVTAYAEILGFRVVDVGGRILRPAQGLEVYAAGAVESLGPVITTPR